jgi:hypothetical protein
MVAVNVVRRDFEARFWHWLDDGRIQCDLCPRFCKLHEEQRGLCFVRARRSDRMVLTTYGRSSWKMLDRPSTPAAIPVRHRASRAELDFAMSTRAMFVTRPARVHTAMPAGSA